MQRSEQGSLASGENHEKLYLDYALAAERYVKKPTLNNWEKKEKAFETYNALIKKIMNRN